MPVKDFESNLFGGTVGGGEKRIDYCELIVSVQATERFFDMGKLVDNLSYISATKPFYRYL